MLDNVSWVEFLKCLGLILIIYYGYVLIRYFRSEISNFLVNRKNMGLTGMFGRYTTGSERSSMDRLEALVAEIDPELIANTGSKAELIQLLRKKVLHHGLGDSAGARKILVNHMLLAAKAAQVDLTQEDLLILFGALPN